MGSLLCLGENMGGLPMTLGEFLKELKERGQLWEA